MRAKNRQTLCACALVGALALTSACTEQAPAPKAAAADAQGAPQVSVRKTAADVPGPAAGNTMTKEYVQTVGRMAYVWGYAMVNSHNRRDAFAYVTSQNGNVPGWNGGVLPMAPVGQVSMLIDYIKPDQTFVACPNQDVVYGGGYFALDKEPVVFQVPDFGDRFWVYALYDARTDEFAEIGKPYGTKPGFYLMVGPNWKGETFRRASMRWCVRPRNWRSPPHGSSRTTLPRTRRPFRLCSARSCSIRSASSTGR